ncbi:MAG TPA: hypothetical protein PKE29_08210 [Phycisphaerales bacterium]|nr:hypothetical protein [Phycisphaerales bacterium]
MIEWSGACDRPAMAIDEAVDTGMNRANAVRPATSRGWIAPGETARTTTVGLAILGAAAAAIDEHHASSDESTDPCRVSDRSIASSEPALRARSDMCTRSTGPDRTEDSAPKEGRRRSKENPSDPGEKPSES